MAVPSVLTALSSRGSSQTHRPYAWLPTLIIAMAIVALVMGIFVLYYIEHRLIAATGQNLTLAAAEITDKLDRLLLERSGDALMMARTFSAQMEDPAFLGAYLLMMKEVYSPVYLWLGVVDAGGKLIASTDPDLDWSRLAP